MIYCPIVVSFARDVVQMPQDYVQQNETNIPLKTKAEVTRTLQKPG